MCLPTGRVSAAIHDRNSSASSGSSSCRHQADAIALAQAPLDEQQTDHGLGIVDLAAATMSTASASGSRSTSMCVSSGPCISRATGVQIGRQVDVHHRVGHPRRGRSSEQVLQPTGREAGLLDQLAAQSPPVGSPATSRIPAGISRMPRSSGGAVLLDEHDGRLPSGVEQQRHHADGARRPHDVAVEQLPVGRLERRPRPPARCIPDGPADRRDRRNAGAPGSAHDRRGFVERRTGVAPATLAPGQRRGDELAEQRVGPVGPALELGMGLRADPERMVRRSSMNSTRRLSGDVPEHRSPAASSWARYCALNS